MLKDFYKGKKVLVTGDSGFKGSWMAIWLSNMGAEVYGYSLPPSSDKINYSTCKVNSMIHHLDGDIRDREKFQKYVNEVKPDIAFHLAAQPLVLDSYNDPVYTYEVNVMGTINFLEAIRKSPNTKASVVITTDKCYRNNEWAWGYRECDPLGGKDPYSSSKACTEILTESYINSFFNTGSSYVATARAGNVIGGGDWADNRIVPDYFRAYIKNEDLQIRNADAIRPWQHVLEPIYGYLLLGLKLYNEESKYVGAWNFGPGDGSHVNVLHLIEKLVGITGKVNYSIVEVGKKLHEATFLKLDISKSAFYLKWKPLLSLDLMLQYTSEGYLAEIASKNTLENRFQQIRDYSILLEQSNSNNN